jgi:hypothetical protein
VPRAKGGGGQRIGGRWKLMGEEKSPKKSIIILGLCFCSIIDFLNVKLYIFWSIKGVEKGQSFFFHSINVSDHWLSFLHLFRFF